MKKDAHLLKMMYNKKWRKSIPGEDRRMKKPGDAPGRYKLMKERG